MSAHSRPGGSHGPSGCSNFLGKDGGHQGVGHVSCEPRVRRQGVRGRRGESGAGRPRLERRAAGRTACRRVVRVRIELCLLLLLLSRTRTQTRRRAHLRRHLQTSHVRRRYSNQESLCATRARVRGSMSLLLSGRPGHRVRASAAPVCCVVVAIARARGPIDLNWRRLSSGCVRGHLGGRGCRRFDLVLDSFDSWNGGNVELQ